jgi:hypothetical protein
MAQVSLRRINSSGETVTVGDVRVTPHAQALILRVPGGAIIWNRPVAVVVERAGQVQRLPIFDVTRCLELALIGLVVLVAIGQAGVTLWRKERAGARGSRSSHRADG